MSYCLRWPHLAVLLLCWGLVVDAAEVRRTAEKDKRKDKQNCFFFNVKEGAPPGIEQQLTNALADDSGEQTEVLSNLRVLQRCSVSEAKLQNLARNPWLTLVEEDAMIKTINIERTVQDAGSYPSKSGLDRVDQRQLPLDRKYAYSNTGLGVKTYVIDTGVMGTHDEFQTSSGSRVEVGFTAIGDGLKANEITCDWHGTSVSSIAGGKNCGAAKETTIVPVRVFSCDLYGSWGTVLSGLNWILGQADPKKGVINMSIGGPQSTTVNQKLQQLIAAGHFVVAASGNDGANGCNDSPNSAPGVLSVGSVDGNDVRSSWSNYGACVVVHAPGENIVSADTTAPSALLGAYGTSMSSPLVAGVIACYLQDGPVSPEEMSNYIKDTATPDKITNLPAGTPNKILYTTSAYAPSVLSCVAPTGGSLEKRILTNACALSAVLAAIPAEFQCDATASCDYITCQQTLPPSLLTQLQSMTC